MAPVAPPLDGMSIGKMELIHKPNRNLNLAKITLFGDLVTSF